MNNFLLHKEIFISLIVAFGNFWIWKVIKVDILFGLFLILLSLLLAVLVFIKFDKKIFLIFSGFVLLVSYQLMASGFDENLVTVLPEQLRKLEGRHGYFADNLGILFQNKYTLRFYKDLYPHLDSYQENIFNSLSPNLYFFSNHPREREKVEEFAKYPSVLIIPFLIGLYFILNSSSYLMLGYVIFAILISGFVKQGYLLGPILFFPLINLLITKGFLIFVNFVKK